MPSKKKNNQPKEPAKPLSEPLQDIAEIVENRPELNSEEWKVADKIIPWLKSISKAEVRAELEAENAKTLAQFMEEQDKVAKAAIREQFEEWKKQQEPLGTEDLKKLLSQEYDETPIAIPPGRGDKEKHTFVVRELPQAVEERFLKLFRASIIPMMSRKEALNMKLDGALIDRIEGMLSMLPESIDVAVKLCVIILDPWEENKKITGEWVKERMSLRRIAALIMLQFEANKYRDFFSQGLTTFQNRSTRLPN